MADADASFPNFKNYAEGEAIPPVDSEDIKRVAKPGLGYKK
jgi:hypothetical protein